MDRVRVPEEEKRRALSVDEVAKLLRVTAAGPERYGLSGFDRAVLYRVGLETGFRRRELAHLTPKCFDLQKARVHLEAQYCKDRRDATQPITMALASSLAGYLSGRGAKGSVFHVTPRTAEMMQADASDAGLPLVDDKGRELVFHSLRHTLRTELARARVSDVVIDAIVRHKPQGIGRRRYTHLTDFELREAIERLPEYPWPSQLEEQPEKAVS